MAISVSEQQKIAINTVYRSQKGDEETCQHLPIDAIYGHSEQTINNLLCLKKKLKRFMYITGYFKILLPIDTFNAVNKILSCDIPIQQVIHLIKHVNELVLCKYCRLLTNKIFR